MNLIRLEAPSSSWVKLNFNGAMDKEGNSICDGIISGSSGEWLGGLTKSISVCNVYIGGV